MLRSACTDAQADLGLHWWQKGLFRMLLIIYNLNAANFICIVFEQFWSRTWIGTILYLLSGSTLYLFTLQLPLVSMLFHRLRKNKQCYYGIQWHGLKYNVFRMVNHYKLFLFSLYVTTNYKCLQRTCSERVFGDNSGTITKTRLFKYIEHFTSKNWKFSDQKLWYFSYFCSKYRL